MRRRGRLELLLVLADGSRSVIPAAWTDLESAGPQAAGTLASLEGLVAMRRVLDGGLRAGRAGDPADRGGVVLAGRDDPVGERDGDAVAAGCGEVPGASGGAVGVGGRAAAAGGDRAAERVDRVCGRRGGGRR